MTYELLTSKADTACKVAVLIDPDKHNDASLKRTIDACHKSEVNFFMVGGSLVSEPLDTCIEAIKNFSNLPIVLFPGSLLQISNKADAILLLSLISGRNPEYLIGNHVIAAPMLRKSMIEIIPTGYILIESGNTTSVQYISNTLPIPSDKTELAVATAMAGEMMGLKTIYLEAGSGAINHVPAKMIASVKKNISVPLIVGGGIRSYEHLASIKDAGADLVVIGNSIENSPEILQTILRK